MRVIKRRKMSFKRLQPKTEKWMSYWRKHPEHQEDMIEYTKKNFKPAVPRKIRRRKK